MSYKSITGLTNDKLNQRYKANEITIAKLMRENAALKEAIKIKEAAKNPYQYQED